MQVGSVGNGWDQFYKDFSSEQKDKFEDGLYRGINQQINHDKKVQKQNEENLRAAMEGRPPEKV